MRVPLGYPVISCSASSETCSSAGRGHLFVPLRSAQRPSDGLEFQNQLICVAASVCAARAAISRSRIPEASSWLARPDLNKPARNIHHTFLPNQ